MSGDGRQVPNEDDPGPRGDGIAWLDPEPVDAATVDCWRCGKPIGATSPSCPFCRAPISDEGRRIATRTAGVGASGSPDASARFMPIFYLYLAFLATSVVYGWTVQFGLKKAAPNAADLDGRITSLLIVELIDTVIVVAGISWATRPPAPPPRSRRGRLAAWLLAILGLGVLLVVNVGYHQILKDALGLPEIRVDLFDKPGRIAWVILSICVQPAIVEELFFRYLALGHLRPLLGPHGAILISSVMFGLAHLFAVLSTPYLILAGIVFGYARLYGRSMALPILLHFAHNLTVLWLDSWL